MQIKIVSLIFCCFFASNTFAQSAAETLLDKSIAFHDPSDRWDKFQGKFYFKVERPGKPAGRRIVTLDNKRQLFVFEAYYDSDLLIYKVEQNTGTPLWNGLAEIPDSVSTKYKASPERAVMYRDYYKYLYGMPMKLKDPGTIIDPNVEQVSFYGKTYNRIRVTYQQGVGDDIWYFYFEPKTSALEAYQFFHDESKNDGEYILFEELIEIDKVKIPANRHWYYNKDEKYLASDILKMK